MPYRATFTSTDVGDDELILLADQLHDLEGIRAICARLQVLAIAYDVTTGLIAAAFDRDGKPTTVEAIFAERGCELANGDPSFKN
jgi:hypothetical protein